MRKSYDERIYDQIVGYKQLDEKLISRLIAYSLFKKRKREITYEYFEERKSYPKASVVNSIIDSKDGLLSDLISQANTDFTLIISNIVENAVTSATKDILEENKNLREKIDAKPPEETQLMAFINKVAPSVVAKIIFAILSAAFLYAMGYFSSVVASASP